MSQDRSSGTDGSRVEGAISSLSDANREPPRNPFSETPAAATSLTSVVKEGYLTKEGASFISRTHQRFFRLIASPQPTFTYSDGPKGKKLGVLHLEGADAAADGADIYLKGPNLERVFHLRADDAAAAAGWVSAITEAVRGKTTEPVPEPYTMPVPLPAVPLAFRRDFSTLHLRVLQNQCRLYYCRSATRRNARGVDRSRVVVLVSEGLFLCQSDGALRRAIGTHLLSRLYLQHAHSDRLQPPSGSQQPVSTATAPSVSAGGDKGSSVLSSLFARREARSSALLICVDSEYDVLLYTPDAARIASLITSIVRYLLHVNLPLLVVDDVAVNARLKPGPAYKRTQNVDYDALYKAIEDRPHLPTPPDGFRPRENLQPQPSGEPSVAGGQASTSAPADTSQAGSLVDGANVNSPTTASDPVPCQSSGDRSDTCGHLVAQVEVDNGNSPDRSSVSEPKRTSTTLDQTSVTQTSASFDRVISDC
eukprot:TRINITY_DN5121_c0_g1_i1.p1 TRINITY_DN5121_c0_g1~~TRINITY_DN5121_c0_g1_i1.p1  ORF type:complete len:479 (+),score=1.02 TRINITY_DN5121_c0_g1_i1:253-1689(+)